MNHPDIGIGAGADTEKMEIGCSHGRIQSHSRQPRMRFGSFLCELCVSVVIAVVLSPSPLFASLTVVNMGASNLTALAP